MFICNSSQHCSLHSFSPDHTVKHMICRESYDDYVSAANLINQQYDGVILNFKLGEQAFRAR